MKTRIAVLLWLALWVPLAGAESESLSAPDTVQAATTSAPALAPPPSPVLSAPVVPMGPYLEDRDPAQGNATAPAPVAGAPVSTNPQSSAPAHSPATGASPIGVDLVEAAEKQVETDTEELSPLVTYDDAELIPVIKALARQARINLVFDPRMTMPGEDGRTPILPLVTLRLENVTARNVLDTVLKNYGYVLTEDPKTGIGRVGPKDPKQADPLFTKVIQLQYTSPTHLTNMLKLTCADQRCQFVADVRTSQLVAVATEDDLKRIDRLIEELDKPTRQILIEAKLLETSQNPQSVKGIDWSGTLQAQRFSFGNGLSSAATTYQSPGAGSSVITPSGRTLSTAPSSSSQTAVTTTLDGTPGSSAGLSLNTKSGLFPSMAFLNADGVNAVLSFLNQDSDTEVVATPRAVTLDNETATLSVMRAFPVRTTSPGSANVAATSQVGYTNVGTMLVVTPRISGGTNVAMKVQPEVSNIDGKESTVVDGKVNTDFVFAFRRVEANVVVPSGHTLVMGGLISDNKSKSYIKVPILGDIPGLGMAFRKESKQKSKQNLIIFITPTILQSEDFQQLPSSGFLRTEPKAQIEDRTPAWDSGKPYDWGKSKR